MKYQFITKVILDFDRNVNFTDQWYGLLLNPFFINRTRLYYQVSQFSKRIKLDGNVLDVGCGVKPYQHLFSSQKYLGIDIKGGGLEDSIKRVDNIFDGKKIPYPSNKFDAVMATEVLEHVEDPLGLLTEMRRVLKPQGKLFLTMPFIWPEHGIPYDFQRYTSFKLNKILLQLNFRSVSVFKTSGVFATCGQLISDFFYSRIRLLIKKLHLTLIFSYFLDKILVLMVCFPINVVFLVLEKIFGSQGAPLGHVVFSEK